MRRRESSRKVFNVSISGDHPSAINPPSRASIGTSLCKALDRSRTSVAMSGLLDKLISLSAVSTAIGGARLGFAAKPATMVSQSLSVLAKACKSRGPPRPKASREPARAISPVLRKCPRKAWRKLSSCRKNATASRRIFISVTSSKGRFRRAESSRAPGPLTVRSMTERSEPARMPFCVRSISRLARVAGSIARKPLVLEACGALS